MPYALCLQKARNITKRNEGKRLKSIGIGLGTFFIGSILCTVLAAIFSSGAPDIGSSYLGFIGFSALYLAGVVATCTYIIVKNVRN